MKAGSNPLVCIPIYSCPVWSCPVPLAQCWLVWLPGTEQPFAALSSGLPAFPRSQKIPWKADVLGIGAGIFSLLLGLL